MVRISLFIFCLCLFVFVSIIYVSVSLYTHLYTHIINKLLHGWFVCTIFIIHSLWRIAKLTRSLRSLVRLTILHNSWIKIVRTHQPWSNLYILNSSYKLLRTIRIHLGIHSNHRLVKLRHNSVLHLVDFFQKAPKRRSVIERTIWRILYTLSKTLRPLKFGPVVLYIQVSGIFPFCRQITP